MLQDPANKSRNYFFNTTHINNEEENPLLGASCMHCLSALQFEDTKAECLRGLVC